MDPVKQSLEVDQQVPRPEIQLGFERKCSDWTEVVEYGSLLQTAKVMAGNLFVFGAGPVVSSVLST